MKIISVKRYFLENQDKKKIKVWLIKEEMTLVGLADKLKISLSMLGAILDGKRAIKLELIYELYELGVKFNGFKYKNEKSV